VFVPFHSQQERFITIRFRQGSPWARTARAKKAIELEVQVSLFMMILLMQSRLKIGLFTEQIDYTSNR
jgi:hypothetical protein